MLKRFLSIEICFVFVFAMIPISSASAARASRVACLAFDPPAPPALPPTLQSWDELKPITSYGLSSRLIQALNAHPRTKRLREVHGNGESLIFQLEKKTDFGGWKIQGDFLMSVISHVFPEAKIANRMAADFGNRKVELADSTQTNFSNPKKFDMSDLKILNSGPALPDQATLRTQLGLPTQARIISAYWTLSASFNQKKLIRRLFDHDLTDIVILSSQSLSRRLDQLSWGEDFPVLSSREWLSIPFGQRPRRALIFNETRERLPYIHATADIVIVMGQGNIFEPIYAGRPAYIDEYAVMTFGRRGWERMVTAARRTGLGHPFSSIESLTHKLAAVGATRSKSVQPFINQAEALDKVMATLELVTGSDTN